MWTVCRVDRPSRNRAQGRSEGAEQGSSHSALSPDLCKPTSLGTKRPPSHTAETSDGVKVYLASCLPVACECSVPMGTSRSIATVFGSLCGIGHTFAFFSSFSYGLSSCRIVFVLAATPRSSEQINIYRREPMILSSSSDARFCVMNWLRSRNRGCPLSTLPPGPGFMHLGGFQPGLQWQLL